MNYNRVFLAAAALAGISGNALAGNGVMPSVRLLMPSARVDLASDTVTLPLHEGKLQDGHKVWFILTDASNQAVAQDLGLVYAPSLAKAAMARSTRLATIDANGRYTFNAGSVDFSPEHGLVAGDAPNAFPPKTVHPGSVGDADYSPFVRITNENDVVLNAPIVAFDVDASALEARAGQVNHAKVHDKVIAIDAAKMEVTLQLTHGFADGKEVVYISTDSNDPTPATMESATYAPALKDVLDLNVDLDLYAFANGPTGVGNPNRQGFNSALSGEGSPLNILSGLTPNSTRYSPLWDIQIAVWTDAAISQSKRMRLTNGASVLQATSAGALVSPAGGPVKTLGLLVNCPVIGFVN